MTFLSFFSGVGGLDLGLERAGMRCVGQVEVSEFRRTKLEKHWPGLWRAGDINRVDVDSVPRADLWAAGFPCKDTSTASAVWGYRQGLQGSRSGLLYVFLDMLAVRLEKPDGPRWVLLENVAGVKTWADEIQGRLAGLGFTVSRLERTARQAGLLHRRRRVFFAANLDGKRLEASGEEGSPALTGESWRTSPRSIWPDTDARTCGVVRRIPNRVDRIAACGDAVCPQTAEWIGRRIMEVSHAL